MTEIHRGRCLCTSVRFEIETPIKWCVFCHCESCRRQCSAPVTAYICVEHGQWRWTGAVPRVYQSSPGVERTFCNNCGTPMSFRSQNMSGLMNFYVAAMDEPERFPPELHVAHEEKLAWLNIDDSLKTMTGPCVIDSRA